MVRRPHPDRVPTPTRSPRRGATGLTAAIAVGLTVVASTAGCSKDHEALGPTADNTAVTTGIAPKASSSSHAVPATVTTVAATTTPATVEEQVKTAYLKIMAAYFRGMADPDPDDPALQQNYSGASLAEVTGDIREYRDAHRFAVPASGVDPLPVIESIAIDGDSAVLMVCLVDDMQLLQLPNRSLINGDIVSKQIRTTLKHEAGRWRVSSRVRVKSWPG
ncbi:MAG: hypothetical protein ABIP03_15955, partial [Aquihabitans sp.]